MEKKVCHIFCRGRAVWAVQGLCEPGSGCLSGEGEAPVMGDTCGAKPVTGRGLREGRVKALAVPCLVA